MLGVYICHFPVGCSINQLVHFGQLYVHQYMGPMMKTFTSPIPEDYPLNKITIPLQYFYSPTDPHTNPIDVKIFLSKIPDPVDVHVVPEFDHIDFNWGINAHILVYPKIVSFVLKYI